MRARIVRHARRRYLRDGFTDVSLGALCAELRIAKKTFYKHFRDKDALVDALVEASLTAYARRVTAALALDGPAATRLEALMWGVFDVSATEVSSAFLADLALHRPDRWEQLRQGRAAVVAMLESLVREAQAEGAYRRDVDPHRAVRAVALVVERALDPLALEAHGLEPHETASLLFSLLHRGMQALTDPEETTP